MTLFDPLKLHTLTVESLWPTPRARWKDTSGDPYDDRRYWLIWSLKRGENWAPGGGASPVDPAAFIAERVNGQLPSLAADRCLVPIPRSGGAPSWPPPSSSWPGRAVAEALRAKGYGARVVFALRRRHALPSSSSQAALQRATVEQHAQSLEFVVGALDGVERVTLVDDTVTEGTQLVGAMLALRRAGYAGEVVGFTAGYVLLDAEDPRAENVRSDVSWYEGHDRAGRRVRN